MLFRSRSSSAVSGHHVAGGESGSGSGSELLGSRDALESPGLWGWGDDGSRWEGWVVGVGGGVGELAGLDTELGSVLQESLGGTAAEWLVLIFQAFLSCCLCFSIYWFWEVAEGTDGAVSWECRLGIAFCFGSNFPECNFFREFLCSLSS